MLIVYKPEYMVMNANVLMSPGRCDGLLGMDCMKSELFAVSRYLHVLEVPSYNRSGSRQDHHAQSLLS